MFEDMRYALRQLRKNPGFAGAAVITLALGIGGVTAMLGLIKGVLLSPPPYRAPDRLVLISGARLDGQPHVSGNAIGQWVSWRNESRTLEPPALYRWTFNFLVLPDGSQSLGGMVVTQNYFKVLGMTPMLGREFVASEASRPKVPATAIILGYDLWQRQFNGDPGIIGQTVRISRYPAPLPVVGVMPPGIRFLPDPGAASEPNYDVNARVDFWMSAAPDESQPRARGWNAIGRLRDGATLDQARTELAALAVGHARTDPNLEGLTTTVRPVIEDMNRQARTLLVPLLAAVILVFVVACVNVAGLFVARGLQRHREYAMRTALGASRLRLFRQLLTESTALSLVSAVAGFAVAAGTLTLFKATSGHAIPRSDMVTIGWPVFALGCGVALAAALLAGLLPAARAASPHHFQGLKGGRTSAGRAERRLLGGIATVQIVLTVALLAGAALLLRSASNLMNVRPGYDVENILAATVTNVTPNTSKEFHARVLERVSAAPGVANAAFVWGLPLTGNKWPGTFQLPGTSAPSTPANQVRFPLRAITPAYFDLMGMSLVEGRPFRDSDDEKAPRVIIVNETLAARYFPGATAIGKRLQFAGNPDPTLEIVGVVRDTRTEALTDAAEAEVYLPFWQNGAFSKHLVVRTRSDPRTLMAAVRQEINGVDPTAAIEHVTTMADVRRTSVAPQTFAMRLIVGFAALATTLALVGVYGVLSLSVGSRVKEMAVRKAVGAQHGDILRLILGEGGRLIAVGVVLGIAVAVLFGRALEAYLYDVTSADPVSLAGASIAFGAAALGACLLPARRAARTDLLSALHQD